MGRPFIKSVPQNVSQMQKSLIDYSALLAMARRFAILQGAKVTGVLQEYDPYLRFSTLPMY